jgi:hypothetical protein
MSPQYESAAEEETDARPSVIFSLIGSATFKWVLGILGTIAAFLLAFGFEAYLEAAASKNPDVVAAKADVDTLKVAVKVLSSTADNHTAALAHADEDRKFRELVGAGASVITRVLIPLFKIRVIFFFNNN